MGFSLSSLKDNLVRATKAVATGGLSEVYEKNKGGIERFFGKEDRRNQERYAAEADADRATMRDYEDRAYALSQERRGAEQAFLQAEAERYQQNYAPIEQAISRDLAKGPALEQEAAIAGGVFASEFDASVAARDRDQLRVGYRPAPGSSAARMQGENDAYNRARGIATSRTEARREEDDAHFIRSEAFYRNNGSGIKQRLLQGMQQMYGADYTSNTNAAALRGQSAGYNQGVSDQYGEQSKEGINTLLNIGGRVGTAIATGGASEAIANTQSFFGIGGGARTPQADGVQLRGLQPSGVETFSTTTQPAAIKTPILAQRNRYMNDGSTPQPGQARAAIAGSLRKDINQTWGA